MTAERPERDLDKEFEALVANWEPTPSAEPSPAELPAVEPPDPPPGVNVWRGPTTWRPAEEAFDKGPSGALTDEDDEDDFTPAPVHLPPQEDLHFWGIVVSLTGGGLLLLWLILTGVHRSSLWYLAALGLLIGGFALLILRQPRNRDLTDDGTRI